MVKSILMSVLLHALISLIVIVHLHYLMSSVEGGLKQNKSVLWAYKKDLLGFTRCAVLKE